ncbi:MAG: hypothetical protein IRZ28_14300 [Steroidobacteraceae bacterium]|nr:hypothetical protein [Steroidobacteraceae bacterium]
MHTQSRPTSRQLDTDRLRIVIRWGESGPRPWESEIARRLRAVQGAEVIETPAHAPCGSADIVLDTSETPLHAAARAPAADHPSLGYWCFVYGDEGRLSDPCTAELAAGRRSALIQLVSIDANGQATLLEGGAIKTVPHSLRATRERMFDAVVSWPERALTRILEQPHRQIRGPSVPWTPAPPVPARFVALGGYARRIAQEMVEEHWAIGIIPRPVTHVLHSFDASEIQWLQPPEGHAIADPLGVVEREGTLTLLAESFDFDDRQGRIVALEVRDGKVLSPPREVLRRPVHLSYPHLIAHGAHLYCLPEAAGAGCVQLFRAERFPDCWVPDRILLQNFAAADATVYRWEGRWWMFVCNHADQDETKLYVFHAQDLFGRWHPHARNPVKCDLRSARPAGPLFEHEGALYRPAQDCSVTYGGAVAVNRVLTLSPTDFAEETVTVLRPLASGPYPHGLHTLTGAGAYTVVDGKRHSRSLRRLAWGLRQLARGLRTHADRPRQPAP